MRPIKYISVIICSFVLFVSNFKSIQAESMQNHIITIYFFYSSSCSSCFRAQAELIRLQRKFSFVRVKKYNIVYQNIQHMKKIFCQYYNVPDKHAMEIPLAFVANRYIRYDEFRQPILTKLIDELHKSRITTPNEKTIMATINPKMEEIHPGLGTVVIAGLVDGINPCAFVTLTFLMSLLYSQRRRRKHIGIIAIFYTLGVFTAYLAMGMGLSYLLGQIERYSWLLEILKLSIGMIAFVFGIISVMDFIAIRRGQYHEVKLKLPRSIHSLIHRILHKGNAIFFFPIGAVVAGVIVSILEFMCTGQVYLPTLVYMHSIETEKAKAILLLVIYNVAFILPLIGIFLIALIRPSVKFQKMNNILIPISKLALSGLFLALGFYLMQKSISVLLLNLLM